MIVWSPKPPAAVANYAFEFADFLQTGETVASQVVTASGVTKSGEAIAGTQVKLQLAAGTAGTVATVTCTITTNLGETWTATAVLEIDGEVVDLATAKMAQKIEDDGSEDMVLAGYLRAAIKHVETVTGKNLTARIETQRVDRFPAGNPYSSAVGLGGCGGSQAIRLFRGPVSSIVSLKYDDGDGVEQTISSFRLVEGATARLLPAYGASWPATAFGPGAVRVTYVAGYDPSDRDLYGLTQAVILLFGHWYANREAAIASDRAAAVELPLGVQALLEPYRTPGIA